MLYKLFERQIEVCWGQRESRCIDLNCRSMCVLMFVWKSMYCGKLGGGRKKLDFVVFNLNMCTFRDSLLHLALAFTFSNKIFEGSHRRKQMFCLHILITCKMYTIKKTFWTLDFHFTPLLFNISILLFHSQLDFLDKPCNTIRHPLSFFCQTK